MEVIELKDTIELRDIKVIPDNCYTYEHHYWTENIPIVIDNGKLFVQDNLLCTFYIIMFVNFRILS